MMGTSFRFLLFAYLLLLSSVRLPAQTLQSALNPEFPWTTGGGTAWEVTTETTHDGLGAQSGVLALSSSPRESWVETTILGPCAVTFWCKPPTRTSNRLRLSIGGVLTADIPGDTATAWKQRVFYVQDGPQAVRWTFQQNVFVSGLLEHAYLDEVLTNSPVPPAVVADPQSQTVVAGSSFRLEASVSGTEPYTFSWLKDGTAIPNATNPWFTVGNAQAADQGEYRLVVNTPLGQATSLAATVVVQASPPVFTLTPRSAGVPQHGTALFAAAAKGTQPITWQWYFEGVPLDGQTLATLEVVNVSTQNYGTYTVVAENSLGSVTSEGVPLGFSPLVVYGNNVSSQNMVPAEVTNVIAMCGGDAHCLALRGDGGAVSWGSNTWGNFQTDVSFVPPEASNVLSVSAGSGHSLVAREDGSVVKWGRILGSLPDSMEQETPSEATNVAVLAIGCGAQHALALRTDGTVVEWGCSRYNLLPVPAEATNVVGVAAGAYHSLALRGDGTVVSWGRNPDFEGLQVVPKSATNVVAIAAGWFNNVALRADGTVVNWGARNQSLPPAVPKSATNIVTIGCGAEHNLAVRKDGTVVSWGSGYPVTPGWVTNVVAIGGTRNGTMALLADGPPALTTAIVDRMVNVGSNAFFTASAVGAWPLCFQWQFNGEDIAGATNRWLMIPQARFVDAGSYSVTVTNLIGNASSRPATLKVTSPPLIQHSGWTNEHFQLTAISTPGLVWKVEASAEMTDWTELATVTNLNGTVEFTDQDISTTRRFYRLRKAR